MYVTLDMAKSQCNIDLDFHDDDQYLLQLIDAAENAASLAIDRKLSETLKHGELPKGLYQAILLLIGTWYSQREAISYGGVNKVPYTVDWLLQQQKIY